ncbi:phospho-N-acetylmuramoyl-pentapeptide-transferase [Nocardioides flavescens]|uniref:Phospho-N-acetylmuramoyl-pentapeptide-transferase n=1 Tax=Nocardioides flavescens TaxID=2691959 RepID=A0A6L7F0W5_9ACTN|nr:phospho-N-acetylmuramoyl-pentapeptide-transferase [Nocardioides flavescens]MXG90835.1 phospho-N-acetylmuramoyl-pentapeptide-transferase [Nocardioides flavescens]
MRAILLSGAFALFISLLGTRFAIKQFTRLGWGKQIRDDGPTSHHTKMGTPTMGGLVIIAATLAGYFLAKLITMSAPTGSALLLLFLFVGLGAVGFLDDYIQIVKQRNLGLRSKAKMIGQTAVALVFGGLALSPWLKDENGVRPASNHLSFIRDHQALVLPTVVVMALIWLIVTATSNGVNLTDGLDGLAAGASMMVFGAYMLVNIWQNNQSCASDRLDEANISLCYEVRDPLDLAIVAAALTGACFGFLWWNASPAAIFMGDTGSLSLGGAMAGLAILTRTELLFVLLGGLFVVETLSVMLQVGFFKATKGRRLFRMAPLHHHFEMLGWEQVTVTIRFWIISGICVAAGLGVFYAEWVSGIG